MTCASRSFSTLAVLAALLAGGAARADVATAPLAADDAALAALALALAAVPSPEPSGASLAVVPSPRVELVTTITARSVAFDDVPRIRVTLGGAAARRAVWRVERVNLPDAIAPGTVYRDVQVKLTLTASLDEFEALLADARRLARDARLEGLSRSEPSAAPLAAAAR
jgi:hypothetical protein